MSKAKVAKFSGKTYTLHPSLWKVENNSVDINFAAEDDLATYVVAMQIAYLKEEKEFFCYAEFFKVSAKKTDYKAYKAAKKDVDSYKEEGEDEFPAYTEKQWNALPSGEKFDLMEPFLDIDPDFEIEMEDFDKFSAKMKGIGIEVPSSLKSELKK